MHIGQGGIGANLGIIGDAGRSPQLGAGVNDDIGAHGDIDTNPGGLRIYDGGSAAHRLFHHASVELAAGSGELHAVIDARQFGRIRCHMRADAVSSGAGDLEHIGDV